MKFVRAAQLTDGLEGRAPQGARGLKFDAEHVGGCLAVVAPRKGRVG